MESKIIPWIWVVGDVTMTSDFSDPILKTDYFGPERNISLTSDLA